MNDTMAGTLFLLSLLAAWAASYRYLGDYLHRAITSPGHLKVEKLLYRSFGADPDAEHTAGAYTRAVLAFSVLSVLLLYAIQRLQAHLPLADSMKAVDPFIAWNTAISFVTNTNWQSYSGEQTMSMLTQMTGLAVQNFLSAAVGIAIAVALIRGLARKKAESIGNFWVDLTRITIRVLLPFCVVVAVMFIAAGMIQNLSAGETVNTLAGAKQSIPGGPVASQEAIKQLGTNGGGYFNANAAHPFENPNPLTNWLSIFLLGAIPIALPRVFGKMVADVRQGLAIVAAMGVIAVLSFAAINATELSHGGTVPQSIGAAMEGREVRFGVPDSATYATSTTLTSTGSVDSAHDSYTPIGGGVLMFNMMLGEVAPGGTGSGLYGMLVLAIITVFVAGLMVGRTPEYLGKRISAREMKLASLYFLVTPFLALCGTALAIGLPGPRTAMLNGGAHGFSEILYAFTSAANNNGSAFGGLTATSHFYTVALGTCMFLGRFLPIIFVLGLAGSLARQQPTPATAGTMPTHTPLYVGMLVGVTIILVALTYLPVLALGPLAEGLR